MTLRSRLPVWVISLLLLLGASCSGQAERSVSQPSAKPGGPEAACVRHLYNDSQCNWTFKSVPQSERRSGNVWFIDYACPATPSTAGAVAPRDVHAVDRDAQRATGRSRRDGACANPNGPCVLEARCWMTIEYTTDGGKVFGNWEVTDQNGVKKKWLYDNGLFVVCPYIQHDGATGPVYLNEPADGDIVAGQCAF